jgi:hypothetical protein
VTDSAYKYLTEAGKTGKYHYKCADMFLRTLVRAGVSLLAGISVASAVSTTVVQDDLDAQESGHIMIRSKVHNATGIRYVKNSGICETTPGVKQVSGYIDVGKNMSMVRLSEVFACVLD